MKHHLLYFDTMITPKIITFVYWALLVAVLGFGLSYMFGGWGGFTFAKFVTGLLIIAGGAITVRVWCELLIVIFKINENLQTAKNKNKEA